MAKTLPAQVNDFGCPHTEMRSRREAFEAAHPYLDFHMKDDAPHYSALETRIVFAKWEQYTVVIPFPGRAK
jgi:hypothetical protein